MTRTAILGGEAGGRGIFGGKRSKGENRLRYAAIAAAIAVWFVFGGITGIAVGAGIYAVAHLITYQLGAGRSVVTMFTGGLRWRWRSHHRLVEFVPPHALPAETPGGKRKRRRAVPIRSVPDAVGAVRLMTYTPSGGGKLAVLHHTNPGQEPYLSAVLEVQGQPSGLYEEDDVSASAERFGRLLSACGGPTSLIDGIQLLTRVVPVDPAIHEWYVLNNRSLTAPRQLFESYAELLGQARQTVEQHRNYLVAKIPLSASFSEMVRAGGGNPAEDDSRCRVVSEEMNRLALLASNASLGPLRMLGPQRLAALLRSLQDPDYFVDDIENVDLDTCWQPTRTTRRGVLTNGKWLTRVARVAPEAVCLEPVNMRWLSPMLIGVQPAVIRTISMLIQMEPARKARAEARRDVAEDRGKVLAAVKDGRITDLSEQSQATASQQRLLDLRAGTGHTGARWGMYVSITTTEQAARRASDLIVDKAGDSGLTGLSWLDGAHDLAQPFTWPLWRGLR